MGVKLAILQRWMTPCTHPIVCDIPVMIKIDQKCFGTNVVTFRLVTFWFVSFVIPIRAQNVKDTNTITTQDTITIPGMTIY